MLLKILKKIFMINKKLGKINRAWCIEDFRAFDLTNQKLIFYEINEYLESLTTENRILWSIRYLPITRAMLSSSFGAHSSVSLHLITHYYPNIPVFLIDTGYLFPETYRFVELLTKKMKLNLHVFRSRQSAAWQEAKYGKLWEQGIKGINQYNLINKIQPMRDALKKLKITTWFAGLRRVQSHSRRNLPIITIQDGIFKFLPIADWNDYQIHQYINQHSLEYHPLWNQGYVSIGDIHTTKKKEFNMKDEDTRFFGLQRECGLHHLD